MHVILLALGLIMALAGITLVGFGMATNAVALGNTLIVAGTTAAVGGLILIGLASAIRQLRRIAQALEARPLPRALGPEAEAAALDAQTPFIAPLAGARRRGEPGREARASPPEPAIETPPAADRDRPPSPAPQPERPKPAAEKDFNKVGSGEAAAGTSHEAERISAIEPEPADEGETAWAPPSDEMRIFKSGVIDGLAYTLYTDGSIEAELAHGTVKFSSIDELRAYLATRE
jgi:hypothetical protein